MRPRPSPLTIVSLGSLGEILARSTVSQIPIVGKVAPRRASVKDTAGHASLETITQYAHARPGESSGEYHSS